MKRRTRILRSVLALILVVLIGALAVIGGLFLQPVRDALLRKTLERVNQSVEGELNIGEANWTRLDAIQLRDVVWMSSQILSWYWQKSNSM